MSLFRKCDKKGLTIEQKQTRVFVDRFIHKNGHPPTTKDIMEYFGLNSSSAVANRLKGYEHKMRKNKRWDYSVKRYCPECNSEIPKRFGVLLKYCSIACRFKGKNNPKWKGDKVGLTGVHRWAIKQLPKPKNCPKCGMNNMLLEMSNTGHTYKRNLEDWEWLCKRCHAIKDGRLEKFLSYARKRGEEKPGIKLNNNAVIEIFNSTDTYSIIAEKFNISSANVTSIKRGRTWSHITKKLLTFKNKKQCVREKNLNVS